MWVTAATFSIRKTRYRRNAEHRKIMPEKGMGGGPDRRPGRSVAFAAQQGGRPFVLQRRVVAAGAPHCAAKRSGAPMSPAPVSPPTFHRLLQFLYCCSSCDICIPLLSGVSAVPQCMSEAGSDGALLRRPGCDRGFMEHEGASAMAAQRHDSSRLHCGAQRLQDPSAAHKKYACFRRRIFCA